MGKERIQTGTKIHFGDDVGKVIEFLEEPNTGLCLLEIGGRGHVFDLPVALLDKFRALENEVERLEAVDADRERHFVLLKEKAVEIKQQFDVMASERNRFNASINRLAEIVGLSGKQCFAPEAVERKAKYELATLRGRVEDLEGKRFPIQGGPSIPWRMIGPHEGQHQKNHGQTLERMAERKGLSPDEALAVLDGEPWTRSKWGNFICEGKGDHPKEKAARDELERRRAAFEDESNALRKENEQLRDWRVKVTASLQNEGGAFYEDVPKLIAAMRDERDSVTERLNEAREHRDQEQAEVERLKRAAVDCDFHVLQCPVLKGEDLDEIEDAVADECPCGDPTCLGCGERDDADEDFGKPDERDEPAGDDWVHDPDMGARG